MKIIKKVTFGLMGAAIVLFMYAGSASAATAWCDVATITNAGINPDVENIARSKYVIFVDCADDNVWSGELRFYLIPELGESGYATALTAMSLAPQTVKMKVASPTDNSLVLQMQLND